MNKGQFKKGNVPYNKGMKRGSVSPNTEFKKGNHSPNFKGYGKPSIVGSRKEVITTTPETTTAKSRGRTYTTRKRTSYARYLWQQHHGPIPEGFIIYNNGHPTQFSIQDLEMISRAELVKRNAKHRRS